MRPHAPWAASRTVEIVNELGLHARSAAGIAKLAGRAKARVRVYRDGESADAASILDLISLECPKGARITVYIEDPSDTGILHDIEALVKAGFGEGQNG